jgi:putative PIN family toxin of toxin-antitoxin system
MKQTGLVAVLDSNVLISLLVFADPRFPSIAAAWTDGRLIVLRDAACAGEFQRVLDYPRLKLDAARQALIYGEFEARSVEATPAAIPALPRCADADDQKFLELAAQGADCLVTGDRELLRLDRRVAFAILTAGALEKNLAAPD